MKTVVRIKSWDDMNDEFGFKPNFGIQTPNFSFTAAMEVQISKNRIVYVSRESIYGANVYVVEWPKPMVGYVITDDMIDKYYDEKDFPHLYI